MIANVIVRQPSEQFEMSVGSLSFVENFLNGSIRPFIIEKSGEPLNHSEKLLDQAIVFVRGGNLDAANEILNQDFGVYLSWDSTDPRISCCP